MVKVVLLIWLIGHRDLFTDGRINQSVVDPNISQDLLGLSQS